MIWFSATPKMFCGSITESLPRQEPQCGYGLD